MLVGGVLGGGIVVFDPNGTQVELIPCEDRVVTNVAFGGPNYTTLYITESGLGRVVTREWPRRARSCCHGGSRRQTSTFAGSMRRT